MGGKGNLREQRRRHREAKRLVEKRPRHRKALDFDHRHGREIGRAR